jgi:thiol-disulfide isomerase/thioredoxin
MPTRNQRTSGVSRQAGMTTPLVLAIILALAAVGGAVYYASSQRGGAEVSPTPEPNIDGSANSTQKDEDAVMDAGDGTESPKPGSLFVPSGEVLAGSTTPYVDFNRDDYDRALREGRTIMLYFYANWCPICRVELSRTRAAFDELNLPGIVGFQVSYNDNETDDFEENLARQFGIAYQHTKVILKGGQQVLKNGETWGKDRYIEELTNVAK